MKRMLTLVTSCTALVACASETPLDHYWVQIPFCRVLSCS